MRADKALIDKRFPREAIVVRSLRRSRSGRRIFWQYFEMTFDTSGLNAQTHVLSLFVEPWDGQIGNNKKWQPVTEGAQKLWDFMKWPR